MKFTQLLAVLSLAAAGGLTLGTGCKSLGEWATADEQKIWDPPCKTRGPRYEMLCIDDATIAGAEAACPCRPASLIERLSNDGADAGVGAKDAK